MSSSRSEEGDDKKEILTCATCVYKQSVHKWDLKINISHTHQKKNWRTFFFFSFVFKPFWQLESSWLDGIHYKRYSDSTSGSCFNANKDFLCAPLRTYGTSIVYGHPISHGCVYFVNNQPIQNYHRQLFCVARQLITLISFNAIEK